MLISAAKSSPSTSPTKLGKQRDGELEDFGSQVFLRLCRPNDDEDLEVEVDLDVTEMEIDEWLWRTSNGGMFLDIWSRKWRWCPVIRFKNCTVHHVLSRLDGH
jgi:hypothetical protein